MKVLVVSYFYPPLRSIASRRPESIALGFAEAGHQVTVLTSPVPGGESPRRPLQGNIEVIEASSKIMRIVHQMIGKRASETPSIQSHSRSLRQRVLGRLNQMRTRTGILSLGRMPDLMDLWISPAIREVESDHWDVVFTTYAPYASHLIGRHLKNRSPNCYWIADFRDPWSEHHNFEGLFPFYFLERRIERSVLQNANLVTTVSPQLVQRFQIQGANFVYLLWNGFDEALNGGERTKPIEGITVAYTGTLYPSTSNFKALLKGVEMYCDDCSTSGSNLTVLIAGRDLANFRRQTLKSRAKEVFRFIGDVSHKESIRIQRASSGLLLLDSDRFDGVPTGKLFEYFAARKPIARIGRLRNTAQTWLLNETGGGVDCADDPRLFYGFLRDLENNEEPQKASATKVQRFTSQQLALDFVEFIEKQL